MVISDTLKDAEAVEERIAAVFDAQSPGDRAIARASPLVEQLDFALESGTVSVIGHTFFTRKQITAKTKRSDGHRPQAQDRWAPEL